ncbi:hypothetical protein ACFWU5_02445 [Nocardia sp. NPDC058640]|uniref:hypothetical protein n=1 Tax=Nocardia sp. NPDC058640 TaxID=3346571 RepID=UPI00364FF691
MSARGIGTAVGIVVWAGAAVVGAGNATAAHSFRLDPAAGVFGANLTHEETVALAGTPILQWLDATIDPGAGLIQLAPYSQTEPYLADDGKWRVHITLHQAADEAAAQSDGGVAIWFTNPVAFDGKMVHLLQTPR